MSSNIPPLLKMKSTKKKKEKRQRQRRDDSPACSNIKSNLSENVICSKLYTEPPLGDTVRLSMKQKIELALIKEKAIFL